MMLVVVLAALALQVACKPYKRSRSNALERNLLIIQIAQLILSLICEVQGFQGEKMSIYMLTVLFLGFALMALEFALIIRDMIQGRDDDESDEDEDPGTFTSVIEMALGKI